MRVIPQHVALLAQCIAPLDTEYRRDVYRKGEFPRADAVRDLDKRYRFDLLYLADRHYGLLATFGDAGYNDAHLDTALRQVVRPL